MGDNRWNGVDLAALASEKNNSWIFRLDSGPVLVSLIELRQIHRLMEERGASPRSDTFDFFDFRKKIKSSGLKEILRVRAGAVPTIDASEDLIPLPLRPALSDLPLARMVAFPDEVVVVK